MNIQILTVTFQPENLIEEAGRTCYKSSPGDPSIIARWIKSGHESVLEHSSVTFRLKEVSRSLTHQLVRHRIASFSQESQRYVDVSNFSYVIPPSIIEDPEALKLFEDTMETVRKAYQELRQKVRKEDARYVLPNATHTEIVVTMNFRELRHFFSLRTDNHAQWEIRKVANSLLRSMKSIAPIVFADMEPTDSGNEEG